MQQHRRYAGWGTSWSAARGCALPRCPEPVPKAKNKITAQIATFLRLRIVAWPPIANWDPKMQEISRKKEPFPLCGDGKESVIAKKVAEKPGFLFLH